MTLIFSIPRLDCIIGSGESGYIPVSQFTPTCRGSVRLTYSDKSGNIPCYGSALIIIYTGSKDCLHSRQIHTKEQHSTSVPFGSMELCSAISCRYGRIGTIGTPEDIRYRESTCISDCHTWGFRSQNGVAPTDWVP
jgi:hypothetical protein